MSELGNSLSSSKYGVQIPYINPGSLLQNNQENFITVGQNVPEKKGNVVDGVPNILRNQVNQQIKGDSETDKRLLDPNRCFIQKFLSYALLFIAIVDIFCQIACRYINVFAMLDDLALLTLSIVFIELGCQGKNLKTPILKFFTIFVWFVGFAMKGVSMSYVKKRYTFLCFILMVIRTFVIFFCIPLTA